MKKTSLLIFIAALQATLAGQVLAGSFNITSGTTTAGQTLNSNGQTGVVGSGGTLSVSGGTTAIAVSANVSITNSGIIKQTGTGRTIRNNSGTSTFSVTNNAGALIQSADADAMQVSVSGSNVTLDNYGSIISLNASAGGAQAIDWNGITSGTNTLHNYSTGLIKATAADAVRPGVNSAITNAGTIMAVPIADPNKPGEATGSDGIDAQGNVGIQITNSGSISGRHGITGGSDDTGEVDHFTMSVTNAAGGTITGVNGSGINIDGSLTSAAVVSHVTVVNNGTITGNFDNVHYTTGDGDGVDVDGIVDLTNNGIIRGTGASGNGSDGLGNNSEGVSIGGGTIVNNAGAEISGQNMSGSGAEGHGILVDNSSEGDAFSATTITNGGTIRGYSGYGIKIIGTFDDTITNNAGGTIRGAGTGAAIQTGGGNDTLTNGGTITGDNGQAIDLGDGDDILKIEGAVASLSGDVTGGTGVNTVTINPGAGHSFNYAGSFANFTTVQVKSGVVTFSGANAYTGTTRVTGGVLILDGANRIDSASALNLDGGTLKLQNIAAANGQVFSSLAVTANSVIDLNDTTSLTFDTLGSYANGTTLSIVNYDAGLSDYAIRFSGDFTEDTLFLSLIDGTTVDGRAAGFSFDGSYTNVVGLLAVPEPSVVIYIVAACGAVAFLRVRRMRKA